MKLYFVNEFLNISHAINWKINELIKKYEKAVSFLRKLMLKDTLLHLLHLVALTMANAMEAFVLQFIVDSYSKVAKKKSDLFCYSSLYLAQLWEYKNEEASCEGEVYRWSRGAVIHFVVMTDAGLWAFVAVVHFIVIVGFCRVVDNVHWKA